jgi:hypothetical protein
MSSLSSCRNLPVPSSPPLFHLIWIPVGSLMSRLILIPSSTAALSTDLNTDEILCLPKPLRRFANWAFGHDDLLSLQVLPFGDFSYSDRFGGHNHLVCPHAWPIRKPTTNKETPLTFRPLRETDNELWSLIDHNMDFLGACPAEPIVAD